ncbi:MAG: non-canonical purine NTP diphosphatase [Bacteroidaceae bacterium]|nr:non-canonical purine NTP diphosphatase [Bacteroidaceae bacterium]
MKIIFATNNKHKLSEVRNILGSGFEVVSLSDIGCMEDIPETGATLKENAQQKAEYIYRKYGIPCFADDTGLEVDALNGAPGIYSARFAAINNAGEGHDSEANMTVLLQQLEGKTNRQAHFKTVICLMGAHQLQSASATENATSPTPLFFEGIVEGVITTTRSGAEGFGYDPIFQPEGYKKTFAELGNEVKNGISHRARAVAKLADFLKKL